MTRLQTLLTGGTVVDPEAGDTAVLNVGIADGTIAYLGTDTPEADTVVDVSGKYVTPGFIDLHSHAQNVTGHRLQVLDGVTTSLELESGSAPLGPMYAWAAHEGRPAHFGYSAGWLFTRMHVLGGVDLVDPLDSPDFRKPLDYFSAYAGMEEHKQEATPEQVEQILALLRQQLEEGAIGVGVLLGYASAASREEILGVGRLCAEFGRPMFCHGRFSSNIEGSTCVETVEELAAVARETGCAVHLCHFNSTGHSTIEEAAGAIAAAVAEGLTFTTEAYPFGTSSTVIGAEFLAPDRLAGQGITAQSLVFLPTGERIADDARLAEIRATEPGGLALIDYYVESEEGSRNELVKALTLPGAAFASDAMPVTYRGDAAGAAEAAARLAAHEWPVGDDFICHPRSTSCFARALAWVHRDLGALDLVETVRRCTLVPARILEAGVPAMARKGRMAIGADADLAVFDLAALTPSTDYFHITPTVGFDHVYVAGEAVVASGELVTSSFPGTAVYGG